MDLADRAEAIESAQRNASIANITQRRLEDPLLDNEYRRICRDCEELIPLARLAANGNAVRCVPCQQIRESI